MGEPGNKSDAHTHTHMPLLSVEIMGLLLCCVFALFLPSWGVQREREKLVKEPEGLFISGGANVKRGEFP